MEQRVQKQVYLHYAESWHPKTAGQRLRHWGVNKISVISFISVGPLKITSQRVQYKSQRNYRNYRKGGAASGESCLHELSRTEGAASAEASLLALCRVAFEANGDQTGKMTRCHFVRRRGEGQYSARGSKTISQSWRESTEGQFWILNFEFINFEFDKELWIR